MENVKTIKMTKKISANTSMYYIIDKKSTPGVCYIFKKPSEHITNPYLDSR